MSSDHLTANAPPSQPEPDVAFSNLREPEVVVAQAFQTAGSAPSLRNVARTGCSFTVDVGNLLKTGSSLRPPPEEVNTDTGSNRMSSVPDAVFANLREPEVVVAEAFQTAQKRAVGTGCRQNRCSFVVDVG